MPVAPATDWTSRDELDPVHHADLPVSEDDADERRFAIVGAEDSAAEDSASAEAVARPPKPNRSNAVSGINEESRRQRQSAEALETEETVTEANPEAAETQVERVRAVLAAEPNHRAIRSLTKRRLK